MSKKLGKKIFVNVLTSSRIVGAFLLPLIIKSKLKIVIFVGILLITDFFDGLLARKWKVQTKGGSLLDPVGDKLLAFSSILCIMKINYYLLINLVLEILIGVTNIVRSARGEGTNPSIFGKVKTFLLSITLVVGILCYFDIVNKPVLSVFIIITAISQIIALVFYIRESIISKKEVVIKRGILKPKEILTRLFDENMFDQDRDKSFMELIRK